MNLYAKEFLNTFLKYKMQYIFYKSRMYLKKKKQKIARLSGESFIFIPRELKISMGTKNQQVFWRFSFLF
jgi:hypothetical protein